MSTERGHTVVVSLPATATQVDAPLFEKGARKHGQPESPVLAKPDWPDGLMLLPEHFAAQDRYHESFVQFALRMACGEPWGVSEIAIDEDALRSGHLRITQLRALLPDMTPVVAGVAAGAPIPQRNVARVMKSRQSIVVYVGLPLEHSGSDGGPARYAAETVEVTDFSTGRKPVELPWARPNLALLFEDEPLDSYAVIPVARVHHVQGRLEIDAAFVPPVLEVRASKSLEASLRRIEKNVAATLAAVSESKRASAEMTGGDAARLLVAMTLGRALPKLQGVLASEGVHPRDAHRVLAELAGALSALTPTGRAAIAAFDFLDLTSTFAKLEESIRGALEAIGGPTHRVVQLIRHDESFWRATITEPGLLGREFLLVLSGGDPASLHAHVPHAVKIAAWEEIRGVVQRAVRGVPLVPEIRRPAGITLPPHAVCFRLDKSDAFWAGIVRHGSIAVWLPAALSTLQPLLIAQERGFFGT